LDAHLNPQDVFAELIAGARFAALPEAATAATKVFLLDTLGTALAGTGHPQEKTSRASFSAKSWTACAVPVE